MLNIFDLTGKVAVITGATRGLGQGMALALAEAGADIALVQRNGADRQTAERIRELGRRCETVDCDLADRAQVLQVMEEVDRLFGRVDILVNNAGIQRRSPSTDFPEDDWDDVIDVNLKSVFLLCREAGKRMVAQKSGKIINIASLLSFQGGFTVPAYAASKGGVAQLTKALSNEWAGQGVNVNAIAPGYMDTEMNTALKQNEVRSRQILERIPAGRWGNPEDMKGAVIYLASRASDYVNGHVLLVDGGWMGR
ncbi:2-dehydro-3-deoxy-D-gluconate 5-dehydrogenase KduD [Paenibacillus thalictri]|uniref:2-dehydro-3-deoxy-D-gluconate 5-dehydrogenase KduD n=1 Tax=Paenibacillus thalictri TaxID=2527873 RepID=A0A4V2J3S4_9BACL|nr:2-dehydro-3-deoxy-D-gluconate 5-dehydrogenase KduD [Paenibacillus thalictri]TBL75139.1 2-dehydro-3-deoxy-D-gluconate 5-dehydrogenase KduD [Paenibacillus thalictri]